MGVAYIATSPYKVTGTSGTQAVICTSNSSIFNGATTGATPPSATAPVGIREPTMCRVFVSGSNALVQIYCPPLCGVIGKNVGTLATRPPKVFIGGLEYPCVDHRPNNTM